jgi:DHA1 family bicyclomycin/chloramphenicol resistance-like MFS transporter
MSHPRTGVRDDAAGSSRTPNFAALVLITGVGPFATDTYIAALPQVQRSLHTSAGTAQLTMTMLIVGLAIGQLVCGPMSDAFGRRRMVLASSLAFAGLSAVCAAAPDAGLLLTARALQGIAGGCGVAIGRAVVSDRWPGRAAAARYGSLAAVTLLAPVIAPALGGVILLAGSWRWVFVFLTALGAAMAVGVVVGIPETLPPERRHPAGLPAMGQRMARLIRTRSFVTPVAVQCLATAAFFTYIGGSSIVLQGDLGISATQYTVVFASNAAGMAAMSAVFRRLVIRVRPWRLLIAGVAVSTVAAGTLAGYSRLADPVRLAPTWVLLALVVAGMGLSIPATTSIAQHVGRATGGTAAALQGGLTFTVGAAATPITGLTGSTTVPGMAAIMAPLFVLASALLVIAARRAAATDDRPLSPEPGPARRRRPGQRTRAGGA